MKTGFANILEQLEGRSRAKLESKLPSWAGVDIDIPSSINFQQCSGEEAAKYKASLLPSGCRVADLTGGLGADSWAMSQRASEVWYNERDSVLLGAVQRNFKALGVENVEFHGFDISAGASDWLESLHTFGPDVVYLDPARRNSAGRKVFLLEECSPDVLTLMPQLLTLCPEVMVKVSPMADLTMLRRRLEPYLCEIHVVGSGGECKELLCICRRDGVFKNVILAEDGFVFSPPQPDLPLETVAARGRVNGRGPQAKRSGRDEAKRKFRGAGPAEAEEDKASLLFVPSAAMTKSGIGPGMCRVEYDEGLSHFGKFYEVLEDLPFSSSVIKELGRRYPKADVTARGVPISSEELRTRLKSAPGSSVHIFACQVDAERRLLVCQKVTLPEQGI